MKKIIAILVILCVAGALFAADANVTFKGMSALDNRSSGMGGGFVTDTSDYFTLMRNPAGLAFSGRHNLIGVTNINLGGPFEEALEIVQNPDMLSDQTAIINEAKGLLSENKLNIGFSLGGPIAIGGTYKNGFGWGLADQVKVNVSAPSTIVKANVELDGDFILGYGHAIDLGALGKIAAGLSADIYAQVPYMNVNANLMNLLTATDMTSYLTNLMQFKTSTGANFNLGLQWRFLDFLNVGAVINNMVSVVANSTLTVDPENLDPAALLVFADSFQTTTGAGTLDIGVGLDIPTKWTLGLISSWGAYADIKDVFGCMKNDPLERNPILNMSIGTEMTLLNFISVRGGISDTYLHAGVGLRLLGLHIDAAVYGKELGTEPGTAPQMNAAISIGIRH